MQIIGLRLRHHHVTYIDMNDVISAYNSLESTYYSNVPIPTQRGPYMYRVYNGSTNTCCLCECMNGSDSTRLYDIEAQLHNVF